jgi:hypothetical protein
MSLNNLNTPNKQWLMYLNTLSSISGDDLTIKPDTRRNLLLEVSGNNNIFIKKGDTSYNLTNYIAGDASFSNVDVSVNLNPLRPNNSNLGLPSKLWGNAYIRDISVTNISISGNMTISGISNVIQIIPRLANDISSSLGSATNIWQRAFIRDLSSIRSINGTNWPITGPAGAPGPAGPAGALGVSVNATLTDISNFRITTNRRIYQEISGGINDLSWNAVNGYYGLAKDAYPSLNPLSNGDLAVRTWTAKTLPSAAWNSVCWSPQRRLFVAVSFHTISVITSIDGTIWINQNSTAQSGQWASVCWSPELTLFVAVSWTGTTMWSSDGISWTYGTSFDSATWNGVCWSPELGLFVAVGSVGTDNRVIISSNGKTWFRQTGITNSSWRAVSWSPELKIFVAVSGGNEANYAMISSNGINWVVQNNGTFASVWNAICWSSQLGIFVAVSDTGSTMTYNGVNWIRNSANGVIRAVSWSPELKIFVYIDHDFQRIGYSLNGNNWTITTLATSTNARCMCWSPELGIFVGLKANSLMTSSLKGRPPTSYNVFDSSFNRINENGIWDFSNINVRDLSVNNVYIGSDDRLKHNEVVITNGLTIIDRLTPKFYQKTQVLLDANYNGDLSAYAWNYEAGLIAQEVLQITDLSYVVGGGDYYQQTYNLIIHNNDLSANYYEPSANYYEQSPNNYEVSYNLIAQAYNLNYNSVFVYGIAAIKELHTKVKANEISILNRQAIINNLITRIEALESVTQDVSNNIL